ncbi:MAG TPA: hypothetical protein VG097_11675 [Gemmata sp.]|jgi:hypothetical protein|nr:hypothetical protein [Gemmata sp.]
MSQEIHFRKRTGKAGEIGLFLETEVFENEWNSIPRGAEVRADVTVPATLKYMRFFRALCGLLAEQCEWLNNDAEFAKEQVLMECRHVTYHHDRLRGTTEIRAKTTRNLTADQWVRLIERAKYAVEHKFLPGTPVSSIREEIESTISKLR